MISRVLIVVFVWLLGLAHKTAAQDVFVPGYIVNLIGDTTEVYIASSVRMQTSSEVRYKFSEEGGSIRGSGSEIIAYGTANGEDFEFHEVEVDISSDKTEALSRDPMPIYRSASGYLQRYTEGELELFAYAEGTLRQYFLRTSPSALLIPLVYKRYFADNPQGGAPLLRENRGFLQTLRSELSCHSISDTQLAQAAYSSSSLRPLINRENVCRDPSLRQKSWLNKLGTPRIWLGPMLTLNSIVAKYPNGQAFFDPGKVSRISYGAGITVEMQLPFDDGRWYAMLNPTMRHVSFSTSPDDPIELVRTVDGYRRFYSISEDQIDLRLALGIRRYFEPSPRLRVHAAAMLSADMFRSYSGRDLLLGGARNTLRKQTLRFATGLEYANRISVHLASDITSRSLDAYKLIFGNSYSYFTYRTLELGVEVKL